MIVTFDPLRGFWVTFGARAQGDPVALTRMPSDIAELADSMWQRALELASQSAKSDHNAARERLERVRTENELHEQSFTQREKEYETAARERERALADTRDQLISTLRLLDSNRLTLRARDARIANLEAQLEDCRRQLAAIINQVQTRRQRPVIRKKPNSSVAAKPGTRAARLAARGKRSSKARPRTSSTKSAPR